MRGVGATVAEEDDEEEEEEEDDDEEEDEEEEEEEEEDECRRNSYPLALSLFPFTHLDIELCATLSFVAASPWLAYRIQGSFVPARRASIRTGVRECSLLSPPWPEEQEEAEEAEEEEEEEEEEKEGEEEGEGHGTEP